MGLRNWRNKLLLDLPMRMADHDPVNTLSVNRGRAGAALNAVFGAGAAEPTKLVRRGYSFDGGDYMQCSAGYQLTTGLVSILFCGLGSPLETDYIFSWETAGGDLVARLIFTNTEYRFYTGGTGAGNFAAATRANYATATGQIHTSVGLHDGTNTLLYINGELAATAGNPLAPDTTSQPMWIGARTDNTTPYNGEIYHVGMADFALSGTQVKQYHNTMMRRFHQV